MLHQKAKYNTESAEISIKIILKIPRTFTIFKNTLENTLFGFKTCTYHS